MLLSVGLLTSTAIAGKALAKGESVGVEATTVSLIIRAGTGARGLRGICEEVLKDAMYEVVHV